MSIIIKRDGRQVQFDGSKIENAVLAAFKDTDGIITDYAREKAKTISDYVENVSKEKNLSIEEIQDLVENGLMASKRKDVARKYIIYRDTRNKERDKKSRLRTIIKEKLSASNVQNQNANVDEYSFGGRMGEAAEFMNKDIVLSEVMSPMARYNHVNNIIYTHDLGHYILGDHNCLTVPFDDLLSKGFNTRQTDVRPAKSISTALQLFAVIFQLQSLNQFGGVSASHADWTLVPYVRLSLFKHYVMEYLKLNDEFMKLDLLNMSSEELDEFIDSNRDFYLEKFNLNQEDFYFGSDKLDKSLYQRALFETIKETYQAVEAMYHNLNTLQSRSGNQLPFTSINYGTCTSPEGRLIIKSLLETSIKGIGSKHRTSIFPCGIFQCMKGVNRELGDPNYDLFRLALRSTAQRLYPNYANVDWSGNEGYDVNDPRTYFATMGCRTANGYDINGLGQLKDGRGNICPVTIIMPTIAIMAKSYAEETGIDVFTEFKRLLDEKIHQAKDQLIERFDYICSQNPKSAKFMYENGLMAGYVPEEGIRSALKHGTLAIGQIGLAETLQILFGFDHTTEKGMVYAKEIESLFKERCAEFKNEYKLNFGVYYTPAENMCYTAMQKFKEKYGVIANVSDKDFFTNSIHVPVWKEMNPFEKIDIESQLTGYSSAGCITYVELDSGAKNNIDALETIVNYAMDKDIPYFAINVPNDFCVDCGYTDEIGNECPQCKSTNICRLRRVTGYLTNDYKTAFNKGKQQEVEMRYKHKQFNQVSR